jgi:glycosyltransferase involved in cell wall biosynthesis
MGRISVLIPTYNRCDLLLESIEAILTQSYAVHEIIVIDDGSTDGTKLTVAKLNGPIRYLHQLNAGKAAALNYGLRHCTGDYVWICDDDDLALPNAAELLVNALEANISAGFAFGRYERFLSDPKTGQRQTFEPVYWPDLNVTSILVGLLLDCFIFQNACLVRRKAFDAVGLFRPDLLRSQDYDMTIRLASRFDAAFVPEVVFLQRAHAGLRGSAAERFKTDRQMEKWLHYDAMIFRDLYLQIPLSDFVPISLTGAAAQEAERSAHLQRACIFWRRKLFDISLTDLSRAIDMGGKNKFLTNTEERICRDFLHPKFGAADLLTKPDLTNRLRSLAATNAFGASIIKALTAPLVWYTRQSVLRRRGTEFVGYLKLLLELHGYVGTAELVRTRLSRYVSHTS